LRKDRRSVSPMDYLILAFYLSTLSYYTGVLIKALPLPLYGLKKLGNTLMIDGVYSAVLAFSFRAVLGLLDYLAAMLGVDWPLYTSWVLVRLNELLALMGVLKILGAILSRTGLSFVSTGLISPLTSQLTAVSTTIIILYATSTVLSRLRETLIAMGIMLHAVPFRLTRSVGAVLISLPIVFSIGAPLMPAFIETISGNTPPMPYDQSRTQSAALVFKDRLGGGIGFGVVEGYDARGELIYRYAVSEKGVVLKTFYSGGFPAFQHTMVFTFADRQYMLEFNPSKHFANGWVNSTLIVPDAISLGVNRILFFDCDFNVSSTAREGNATVVLITTQTPCRVEAYFQSSDAAEVYLNGSRIDSGSSLTWSGLRLQKMVFDKPPGTGNLTIISWFKGYDRIQVEEQPFISSMVDFNAMDPESLVYPVSLIMVDLLILPLVYTGILVTASLALARLLGGVSPRVARTLAGV